MTEKIVLTIVEINTIFAGGTRRYATGDHGFWIDIPRRRKPYVCSDGVSHLRYWATHRPGGTYPIRYLCEHEIIETIDPQCRTV